jgi:hypothetical protein
LSFLTLAEGIPDFRKAVMSLWFRAPKLSVVAASSNYPEAGTLQRIIPLVTFGKPQQNKNYQLIYNPNIATGGPLVLGSFVGWEAGTPYDVDPCFVGLACEDDGTFRLVVNLQLANYGSYGGLQWFHTLAEYTPNLPNEAFYPGSGVIGAYTHTVEDGSFGIQDAQPEYFRIESATVFNPDVWHHLLLSFDLGGSCTIGPMPASSCRLWYAVDDNNYSGADNLGPFRDPDDGLDPNAIVPNNVLSNSIFEPGPELFWNRYVADPFGSYSPDPVPSSGANFSLPASVKYVDAVFRVEMAEFQMWTGIALDTGFETNRRGFIDANGEPVPPDRSQAVLGKQPEILLHGSSNWSAGTNTGALGVSTDGKPIAAGQFQPTALTRPWRPDPSLHGPQGPQSPAPTRDDANAGL